MWLAFQTSEVAPKPTTPLFVLAVMVGELVLVLIVGELDVVVDEHPAMVIAIVTMAVAIMDFFMPSSG
jgi:hypothetical protein